MLYYPKHSNADYEYSATISSEYEINGFCFNINGTFNFFNKILRNATMPTSTTYIFPQLLLRSTRLFTDLHFFPSNNSYLNFDKFDIHIHISTASPPPHPQNLWTTWVVNPAEDGLGFGVHEWLKVKGGSRKIPDPSYNFMICCHLLSKQGDFRKKFRVMWELGP
jgi:hypothetical protein